MSKENEDSDDADYEKIANRSWEEIPDRDPILPPGTYILRAKNATLMPPKNGNSARVLFFFTPTEALDDVPADLLAALGKDGEEYDLTSGQIVKTMWLSESRDWRPVKELLKALGAAPGSVIDALKTVKGHVIKARLGRRSFTNKQTGVSGESNEIEEYQGLE